ncbi:histidine phosphatase superfamily [Peziza echinospora]|nr:histidine phosphatase superfamily [Peziza echinospora]
MLETIYVTRHGFRSNWVTDPKTGATSATILSPTGIPSDPPLSSHGVDQSHELAAHITTLHPPPQEIYTSPFYRCLQTISPTQHLLQTPPIPHLYAENGIGEWFGRARFDHPKPASPEVLHTFFPEVDTTYVPTIIPSERGESVGEIHDRVAYALARVIERIDRENRARVAHDPHDDDGREVVRAILLCAHAASNIAIGRTLVGDETFDVKTGTCSMSVYQRRPPPAGNGGLPTTQKPLPYPSDEVPVPRVDWKGGKGVGGGWASVVNGDCSFLKDGEERNWWFSGEEDWDYVVPVVPVEAQAAGKAEREVMLEAGIGGPGTVLEAGRLEGRTTPPEVAKF